MGFREALLEESEKAKQKVKSWEVIAKRCLANFLVLLLLLGSAKLVVLVVERSTADEVVSSWYRQVGFQTIAMFESRECAWQKITDMTGLLRPF